MKNTEAHLHVAVTQKLKDDLEEVAISKGLTVSMYVRMVLSREVKNEQNSIPERTKQHIQ